MDMKHCLIASFAALGLVATPALAATAPAAKPTNASLAQHKKGDKIAGAKVTKASLKTSKNAPKSN
jgi:hypothetical protein